MVSSSLDKNIRKALNKDNSDPTNNNSINTNTNSVSNSGANYSGERLPPNDKIQLLFPKCKPRSDYQYQTSTTASTAIAQEAAILVPVASSSSSQAIQLSSTLAKGSADISFAMNNSKHIKLLPQLSSPDHKKLHSHPSQLSDHAKKLKSTNKYEPIDNYAETNPFRTDSNNQYFYTPNDSLFDNNNSANPALENNSMMHHYHYPPYSHRSYQRALEDRSYFFEPDEIEHNPYSVDQMSSLVNAVPSSILKASPPATPPALTTTPIDSSPIGNNRNIWDLSPIKANTPTRLLTQSPTPNFMRSHKNSHQKLLASPAPIEEDLETGHFYYNSKKPYYQAPQTDSDSNEPSTVVDVEVEKPRIEALYAKPKMKHSESVDYIYAEVRKKEERKLPKSKSGSGIMEYDGSPRRFGASSNEDLEQFQFNKASIHHSKPPVYNTYSPSSLPRPGFPQRVVPSNQYSRMESPIEPQKHYYGDQKIISQLIPTTLINYSASEATQSSKPLTIYEETHDSLFEEKSLETRDVEEKPAEMLDNSTSFQVTSPTEEYMPTSTFDYLYEFSETRKVLEEFFKCPETDKIKELEKFSDFNESDDSLDIQYDYRGQIEKEMEKLYSKQISPEFAKQEHIDDDNRDDQEDEVEENAYMKTKQNGLAMEELNETNGQLGDHFVDTASRSSLGEDKTENENDFDNSRNKRNRRLSKSVTNNNYVRTQSKNFNYSPDTTDYDSNYGDFDFERESPLRFLAPDYSTNIPQYSTLTTATIPSATVDLSGGPINNYARYCTSMPVLEDGLSSGHASDNENNNQIAPTVDIHSLNKRKGYGSSISTIQKQYQENLVQNQTGSLNSSENNRETTMPINCHNGNGRFIVPASKNILNNNNNNETDYKMRSAQSPPSYHSYYPMGQDNKDLLNASNNILNSKFSKSRDPDMESLISTLQHTPPPPAPVPHRQTLINETKAISPLKQDADIHSALKDIRTTLQKSKISNADTSPTHHFTTSNNNNCNGDYNDRISVLDKPDSPTTSLSPVWIPRSRDKSALSPMLREASPLISKQKYKDEEDDDVDTDLETDRLLGHQLLDDGFYDDKAWVDPKQQHKPLLPSTLTSKISPKVNLHPTIPKSNSSSIIRHGLNALIPPSSSSDCCVNSPSMLTNANSFYQSRSLKTSPSMNNNESLLDNQVDIPSRKSDHLDEQKDVDHSARNNNNNNNNLQETTDLCNLESELVDSPGGSSSDKSKKDEVTADDKKKRNKNKEVLIEGVLFRARYLGSTQLVCEGQPTKSTRMMQAEEAVSRIKALAPDGENQPSTEVDLFISTEKIMVLNTDLKEIMMDHALRTISYIADIGDLVVLMARRRFVPQDIEANSDSGTGTGGSGNVSGGSGGPTPPTSGKINRTPKMICHVFESGEASFIASSIGNAFQVAYMEFLKANGIEDHSFMKEMDYQEVLNSQEIFGDELEIFAKKELQKEVVVPKAKGEILGVVIVESGWGSMLPTVVIANLASNGAAARCGQLNIGDQIIAINGLSLVGLPLSQCQTYIKNTKNQTVVKFTVVPCAPVVEVKIKRPNTKYQLGFSVQNGVICSLLRGGIAERGGVRVGHRIIEINNQSVVAVPHEKIVNLLATSVGEILMKTMPTSMFRLLTGQENPIYI